MFLKQNENKISIKKIDRIFFVKKIIIKIIITITKTKLTTKKTKNKKQNIY